MPPEFKPSGHETETPDGHLPWTRQRELPAVIQPRNGLTLYMF